MKQKVLDAKTFGELLESVREGGAILRGGGIGCARVRERTSLSQLEFASLIGVSIKTL